MLLIGLVGTNLHVFYLYTCASPVYSYYFTCTYAFLLCAHIFLLVHMCFPCVLIPFYLYICVSPVYSHIFTCTHVHPLCTHTILLYTCVSPVYSYIFTCTHALPLCTPTILLVHVCFSCVLVYFGSCTRVFLRCTSIIFTCTHAFPLCTHTILLVHMRFPCVPIVCFHCEAIMFICKMSYHVFVCPQIACRSPGASPWMVCPAVILQPRKAGRLNVTTLKPGPNVTVVASFSSLAKRSGATSEVAISVDLDIWRSRHIWIQLCRPNRMLALFEAQSRLFPG